MAHFHSPRIITDGLVLCLDAANTKSYPGSGTTWTDLSNNGNNGSLINGPTFSSDNLGSISFDGVNDYVNIPNFTSLALSSACTISIWSFIRQNKGYHFWGNGIFLVQIQSNGNYRLRFNLDGNWRSSYSASFSNNIWHKLDITWDGNITKIYTNSQEVVNSTADSSFNAFSNTTTQPLEISRRSSDFSDVNIAGVQLYNKALTPSGILQNYNATKGRYGL